MDEQKDSSKKSNAGAYLVAAAMLGMGILLIVWEMYFTK